MCGVILGQRKDGKRVCKAVIKRYKNQDERGKRGFGYIAIKKGRVKEVVRTETESEILGKLKQEDASEILFHHRTPTSTGNVADSNHPITVSNKVLDHDYYVIHNGVLTNDIALREEHEKMGFEYTTTVQEIKITKTKNTEVRDTVEKFNDSEAFAVDLALYLDGKSKELKSRGSIAFIALQTNKKGKVLNIFYGRNEGNPLVCERDKRSQMFFVKSKGQGSELNPNVIMCIDYKTGKVTEQEVAVGESLQTKNYRSGWNRGSEYPRSYGGHNSDENLRRIAEKHTNEIDPQTKLPVIYQDDPEDYSKYFTPEQKRTLRWEDDDLDAMAESYYKSKHQEDLAILYEDIEDYEEDLKQAEDKIEEIKLCQQGGMEIDETELNEWTDIRDDYRELIDDTQKEILAMENEEAMEEGLDTIMESTDR